MSYILGQWGAAIVLEHQSMYCRPYGTFVDHLDAAAGGKWSSYLLSRSGSRRIPYASVIFTICSHSTTLHFLKCAKCAQDC